MITTKVFGPMVIVAAAFGVSFGTGAVDVYNVATDRAADIKLPYLYVEEISYNKETGLITQQVYAANAKSLTGTWGARIIRPSESRIICTGGGSSEYRARGHGGVPVNYTPSEWTNDKCPSLETGDIATATWERKDARDFTHIISGEVVVK